MIQRQLARSLQESAKYFSAVALLGPRQSGKTTLARATFPNHTYVSLEEILGAQELANRDPKGFLAHYANPHGIIIDEFQHAPVLLSYIQLAIDANHTPGYFILTGSQNFLLNQAISQSLAGRIAIHTLLPLSINELTNPNLTSHESLLPNNLETILYKGLYPGLYSKNIPTHTWYTSYIQTYLERDVRQLENVTDLRHFAKFAQLCAGRIGQLLNIPSLANDCGISPSTAQSWLSVLEASYLVFLVSPYYNNFSKRLIKEPKIYFYDTGLACSLLNITSSEQIYTHYLRGGLFESMVISDIVKQYYNTGHVPRAYFWRDKDGHEVDCLFEDDLKLKALEIKSGATLTPHYFDSLEKWRGITGASKDEVFVIYGGDQDINWPLGTAFSWKSIEKVFAPRKK